MPLKTISHSFTVSKNAAMSRTLFGLFISLLVSAQAKIWNAQELAIGEWDVTLKGGWFFDPSSIFPKQSMREVDHLPIQRQLWGSTLVCSLSLCQDGTFVLTPRTCTGTRISRRLGVRGQWNVLSNPYCITDRFYDQLKLKSYPRATLVNKNMRGIPRSGSWDLSCRVWGRHTKSQHVGRTGRMTHGSLVWKDGNKRSLFRPRRVVASFSAKRAGHQPHHEGWEDQEFFGY